MKVSRCLIVLTALFPSQAAARDLHHDFRDQPWPGFLTVIGPDAAEVAGHEVEGMRITLPAKRKMSTQPVGVAINFSVIGDFEITATYELLSTTRPRAGAVGVILTVAPDLRFEKMARLGRWLRAKDSDIHLAEGWAEMPPPPVGQMAEPTEARSGKLRLERKRSLLRYLVAGHDGEFHELLQTEFGAEHLAVVRFAVTSWDSSAAIDVRLLSFDVRDDGASDAAVGQRVAESGRDAFRALIIALAVSLVGALIALVLYSRRRGRRVAGTPTSLAWQCSACAQNLKAKAELAGKKVKCTRCGEAVLVPGGPA